nr:hypothetical protein BaRGS_008207 [Batillaria attramentaria]
MRGGESYPAPPTSMATLPLPRGSLSPGWQPQRVLPEVSDDDDDDDAFVSESVMLAAGRSAWQSRQGRVSRAGTGARLGHGLTSADDTTDGKGDNRGVTRLGHVSEETEDRDDSLGDESACSPRRRRDHLSSSLSRDDVVRRRVTDGDGGDEKSEEGDEDVATTDYHHAPLSWMSLPSGDRIRPLIARTIATQTPHLHCQLIDQILDCPQGVPGCARGSAVRRLRYYSEGEETVGQSSLPHGPLPDLVPVTHVTRERSLSAPDLETLQRQRLAAREVGRELRRISDEFLHTYNARADNRDGAVAALHAELNGVAAFFLTGVRRFMYRGFAGYFRHVFNWTRRAMNSAVYTPDSSVDEQR